MSETTRETISEAASQAMRETGEGTNRRERADRDGFNWGTAIAMGLFHVGAIAALFFFTWPAFFVAIFLWWVSGSLGIGMSYHRLLTHRGYRTPKWVEYFLTWCATLALEGGPIFWVATHRIHHQFSDDEGDPHSPIDGKWWSHMGWILMGKSMHHDTTTLARYVPDLTKDKVHVWLTKYHWTSNVILGVILYAIGGLPWLLWGVFMRTVVGLHSTWMVNSITHMWGTRRFVTKDLSTNNFLIASADLRRRLAQQSSCASGFGATRIEVVRNRHELVRHLGAEKNGPGAARIQSQPRSPAAEARPYAGCTGGSCDGSGRGQRLRRAGLRS